MFKRIAQLGASLAIVPLAATLSSAQNDPIELFPLGVVWKYLDNNVEPPFNWKSPSFDDSGWAMGPGQLGFGDGDEATVLQRGNPRSTSFYFRHTFNVTQAQIDALEEGDPFYQLIFTLVRDDGAIVYVNGEEWFRSNVADNKFANHQTVADGAVGGTQEDLELRIVRNADRILEAGDNVIAVSVHQNASTSSDISFDLALSAQKVAPTFGVYHPPVGITFEDAGQANFFTPIPNDGDEDLGWEIDFSGAGPVGTGTIGESDEFPNTPEDGFINGFAFYVRDGTASLVTQTPLDFDSELRYRVDLRNYEDVMVRFGIRADDSSAAVPGFEAGDHVKYTHRTSVDGTSFDEETVTVLQGGSSGGGGTISANPLVEETDERRGLVPTAQINTQIGTSWREVGFDDSSWQAFTGGLGYDSRDYLPHINWDTRSLMRNKNASCYMRVPFTVTDKSEFDKLILRMRDDDGFVAFINGVEVWSSLAPANLTWNSTATGNRSDEVAAISLGPAIDISEHIADINVGENVLAIHCLNANTTSSDFLMSPALDWLPSGELPKNDPPQTLNDVNCGLDGPLSYFEYDVDDSVNSYTFEVELRTNELDELLYFDNWEITGTPLSVDGYDSWVQLETNLNPAEDGDPLVDPDNDGIINLLEFAFGSDPEVNALTAANGQSIMPKIEYRESLPGEIPAGIPGEIYCYVEWRQRDGATSGGTNFPDGGYETLGLRYIPQFSTDLIFWEDGRNAFPGPEIGEPEDNGDGTLTYRLRFRNPILEGTQDEFFARLLVVPSIPLIPDTVF